MLLNSRLVQASLSQPAARGRQKRSYRPALEFLEPRTTPTIFTWANLGWDGVWENADNWTGGGVGAYPGYNGNAATTNDVARFTTVNDDVTMQSAHVLARLEVTSAGMGAINLGGNLTLNDGGVMAGGTLSGGVTVTLAGGTFDWTGGDIAPTGGGMSFIVSAGTARFAANGRTFGADLYNHDTVDLANTGAITLANAPFIWNEGWINIISSASGGLAGNATTINNRPFGRIN